MAQTVVTNFYSTKKRFKDTGKSVKTIEQQKLSETLLKEEIAVKSIETSKPKSRNTNTKGGKKVNKVTNYLKSNPDKSKSTKKDDATKENTIEASQDIETEAVTNNLNSKPDNIKSTKKDDAPKKKKIDTSQGKKTEVVTNFVKSNPDKSKSTEKDDAPKEKIEASHKKTEVVTNYFKSEPDECKSTKTDDAPKEKKTKTLQEKKTEVVTNSLKSKPVKSKTTKKDAARKGKKIETSRDKKTEVITDYLKPKPDKSKSTGDDNVPKEKIEASQDKKTEVPRTPKRNLSNPDELTPSKKKVFYEDVSATQGSSDKQKESAVFLTPTKVDETARRKLLLSSTNRFLSPRKIASPVKNTMSPQKAASYGNMNNKDLSSLLQESRTKILFSGRLEELKKSLEKFSKVSAKAKDFQANSYKVTSVISSAKTSDAQPKPFIQGEPAYKSYSYLVAPESHALILPYKYKLLGETFRCMDTVVSMLNNRKEKITFEKVQNGVEKMMNKNFPISRLGQILTVFPEAYSLQYEKNDSFVISNNNSCYQLALIPKLTDLNGNSTQPQVSSRRQKKTSQCSFIQMTPQLLLERKNIFLHNLTNIVKRHHKDFLTKVKFPAVEDNAILRWHPKFNVDGVQDIRVAALPEEPESKVHTAKDVLSKIRGTVRGRVEKALQSVADEHKTESNEKSVPEADTTNKKQSSALKGICTDLLEKIRARESAKLVERMTRSVQDEKRDTMLERLPKIVHILWHYFIAEQKAAVPVDAAVDKIIHSYNSLTTPEEVKEHIQLITETMPGWLSFIKIPKGEYITMDKKKDINEMIGKLK